MAANVPIPDCKEFVAAEGSYDLQQDIFLEYIPPTPALPTLVSMVSVKYKDYFSHASNSAGGSSIGHGIGGGGFGGGSLNLGYGQHVKQGSSDSTKSFGHGGDDENSRNSKHFADGATGENDDDFHTPANSSGALTGNFHGNLGHLPLYNGGETTTLATAGISTSGVSTPTPPQPPPPLLTTLNRSMTIGVSAGGNHHQGGGGTFSSQTLGRSFSFNPTSNSDDSFLPSPGGPTTPSASSSAGFSSFFGGKRKKPKNNIAKTNSTFVAKITTHENLAKILANRVNEDVYLFWNVGKTFSWSDLGQKPGETLSHIVFTKASPTSHDVNVLTRSCDHLDVIIGFSTGDIIWFDPLNNKYYRLNKQAIIKDSAVTMIKWMPGSESQFMAAFHDGSIVIMDKERDDNAFTTPTVLANDVQFHVTRPKGNKHNPISHWQVCKKPITNFAFSPDLQHVAVVSMDGCLRIIDVHHERLLETFQSYFGALNCVCWSPDGKYLLTGGQDDLVTIWSFKDQRIIARCQGHQSYVTGVAFDPWRCDERNYRFGSVGEDAKLLLWDFSVGALHKPKVATASGAAATQRRGSTATILGGGSGSISGASGAAAAGAVGGNSTYKKGHGSKSSISSLRGVNGLSLFPKTNSSTLQFASQTQPSLAPVQQEGDEHSSQQQQSSLLQKLEGNGTAQANLSNELQGMSLQQAPLGLPARTNGADSSRSSLISSNVSSIASVAAGATGASSSSSSKTITNTNTPYIPTHVLQHQQQQQQQLLKMGIVPLMRPPEPRSHVAMLQPLMAKTIHTEPLATITFREDAVITSDRKGHIRVWKRPSTGGPNGVWGGAGSVHGM